MLLLTATYLQLHIYSSWMRPMNLQHVSPLMGSYQQFSHTISIQAPGVRTPKRGLSGTSDQPSCLRPPLKLLPATFCCSACCVVGGSELATCAPQAARLSSRRGLSECQ